MADTKVILGTAFVTDKGTWASGTAYEQNDIVHTDSGVFMSLTDNNTAATTDTTKWRVWLDKTDINTATKNATSAASTANTAAAAIDSKIATKANASDLTSHTSNKSNPHGVTKAQVGLGNVDNTSDADKPVSTAVQKALDLKLDKAELLDAICPTYTLEQTSNPVFDIFSKDSVAYTEYMKRVGGYMLFFKDGKAYAAKLNASDWNTFADGADASAVASQCETMVRVPRCHFLASGKTMRFGGLTDIGGHYFDSPEWVGAYEMYVDSNSVGHSRPDVAPAYSKTMSAFWNCAQALHTDAGLANYGFYCLINTLFQLGYGNLDSQSAVGTGGQTSSWETWRDVVMGYGRSIGDGSGTASTSMSGQNCVKLFGFEDLWGKLWEFRPNIRFYYSNSVRHAVVYEGNQVSNTATGRDFTVPLMNAGGAYATKMQLGEYWDMVPTAVGGSSTTYYSDGYWDASGGELLDVGGRASSGAQCGVSFAASNHGFSLSWPYIGARLAFYGDAEIVSGTELVAMVGA